MEQNNFEIQDVATEETREPLPTFDEPQFYAEPETQAAQPLVEPSNPAEVEECVNSAFGKSLAAAIMAWFPIVSILAIIFGSIGFKATRRAEELAQQYGVEAGGKNIAAKVLGKVGFIAGIVMTVIYVFTIGLSCVAACAAALTY